MSADNICADWPRSQLEQCVESIIDYRGKTPIKTTSGIPLITAKVIEKGRIDWGNVVEFISEDDYESWMNRGIPAPGAVVITTEAPLGEVAQLGTDKIALAQRVLTLCGKPGLLDNTFLRYVLQTVYVQGQLLARGSGTTVIGIKQSELRKVLLPVPSLSEQRAIAAILSALDDKIELNRQMNKTLEEMAQAIFKEWFVDFGPFRDGGMQDTELGPIPVGWRVEPIGSVAKINARVRRKDYQHQLIQYIDISSVNQGHLENTTPYKLSEAPSRAQRLVADQDILWSCVRPNRRSYYYVLNPADNLVVSTVFAVLSPERVPGSYLYQWVTTDQFVEYLTANADGSAYPAVRADHFAKALCVVPPNDILADFDACVHPMRSNIAFNSLMNTSLAAIRDTLLPKLMSGEIRVPVTEESA